MQKLKIIFTDLDGTLLDHHSYSFQPAKNALDSCKKQGIPIIITSSKTAREIYQIQQKLNLRDPFIAENGSAIFFYDKKFLNRKGIRIHQSTGLFYKLLGLELDELIKHFRELAERFPIKGIHQMSLNRVISLTGLDKQGAQLAAAREFSIPFIFEKDIQSVPPEMKVSIQKRNLSITRGGRFFHLLGDTSKGHAIQEWVSMLKESGIDKEIETYGLGDAPNDAAMLQQVNHPMLVEKQGGGYHTVTITKPLTFIKGVGPIGWNHAVNKYILKIND